MKLWFGTEIDFSKKPKPIMAPISKLIKEKPITKLKTRATNIAEKVILSKIRYHLKS